MDNETETSDLDGMIQTVIITFSDGNAHAFTGGACCREGDERTITGIVFSEPGPLPEGAELHRLERN